MFHKRHILGAALAVLVSTTASLAEDAVLRIATQVSGTVNWELTTIASHGLDKANGFTMQVQDVAAGPAAQVAFQAGEADVIVSDWLWVARQRAAGDDFVFIPYSRAVGALHVGKDSTAQTLADLKGGQIGIAGGPVDKSWLILRAYAQQEYGMDLAAETEQVFGAPPLIFETALSGDLDAAVNFWHFGAKMEAAGMRPLVTVAQAGEALGLDANTPLLGYVVRGELLRDKPELVAGLAAASRGAKEILATDDAAWEALRPQMNAKSDAQFAALKAGFRAGIPAPGPVDEAAAQKMLEIMASLGGEELVGKMTSLPEGVFVQPGS
ncbi:NitT/TauT family transport system substrate-binding protein [Gemmobacter aquatilis]|uniref:NitT/TauT family transport system substrate-binding protein n=1 Tax=Gemmobacter aquatilis TaxID=933059 RepID=A0A1H8A6D0_9RHOB|nr:ABC transporter substrate-binding protein [Gemmobacter aquatilis]SEM65349.1 NitT/TauT family transport system substrate-binding protein [Gemmobacter aquatilis]